MELSEMKVDAHFNMLVKARANLWRMQERLGVKPDVHMVIMTPDVEVHFDMGSAPDAGPWGYPAQPRLECHMSTDLLLRILTRQTHWNNAEVAFDILFDRRPNTYMPDVHTLMSFFHLPGGVA